MSARLAAYEVVRRTFEEGAYADRAFPPEADKANLDERDRRLAMRLAYGTVQRVATLDHVLAQLSSRPPERLDAPVLAALRLGLYELLYLSGSPDYAVVADAVELAKGRSESLPMARNSRLRGSSAGRRRSPRRVAMATVNDTWQTAPAR